MSVPTETVIAALEEAGCKPKRSGRGWSAKCPAHDDQRPSLSVSTGDDGRALICCHAGCTSEEITKTLGLNMRDLMPKRSSAPVSRTHHQKPQEGGSEKSAGGRGNGANFASANDAVSALERKLGPCSRRWVYANAAGEPVGVVVCWDLPSGKKEFRPISRRGDRWYIGAMPEPRPPLGLPELTELPDGAWVYIVEGEKAVDATRAIGMVATTSSGGSNAAAKTDWSVMRGKVVVIMPDHDDAGERYAADVAGRCRAAGAAEVRILRLVDSWPNLPRGGDIADVIEMERGEIEVISERIDSIAVTTEPSMCAKDEIPVETRPIFNADALFPPGTVMFRDFFCDLARSTQTPLEMAALLGIAVVSSCICNVVCIRGHGDHIEPAPIWALVLSDPGTRKSAVLIELLLPILKWEAVQAREMQPIIAAAAQTHRIKDKRLRGLEDRAAKDPNNIMRAGMEAEAIQLAQELEADPIPTPPELLASEPTPEALIRQMKDNHGRALLASAEGDAIDIMQGRYSGVRNYGAMLKGHAGDPIRAQRIGRSSDGIDHPALAVAFCVQPAAVEELWRDPQAEGRGLLARFAVIAPPDLVGWRDVRPEPIRSSAREAWRSVINRLLSFEPSDDPEIEPVVISLSPEADKLYLSFQLRTEDALGWGDLADRRAWGGKLCGLALRVALTLHALATWGRDGTPSDAPLVNAETMAAAIAWAEYLAAAERHARLSILESTEQRAMRRRIELISQHGGSISIRDWQRLRSLKRAKDAEAELNELVEAGHGVWTMAPPGPQGGRPSQRFVLLGIATAADTTASERPPIAQTTPSTGVSLVLSVSERTESAPTPS